MVNTKLPVNLNLNTEESQTSEFSEISDNPAILILRNLKKIIGKDQFRQLLYSSLTGIQILVRGPKTQRIELLHGLSSLVPRACRRVHTQAVEYLDLNKYNFIGT